VVGSYAMVPVSLHSQKYVAAILAPLLQIFHASHFKNPDKIGLDKIERYFKDYKPQIKNRPAGIGPSAKGERDIGCKALR